MKISNTTETKKKQEVNKSGLAKDNFNNSSPNSVGMTFLPSIDSPHFALHPRIFTRTTSSNQQTNDRKTKQNKNSKNKYYFLCNRHNNNTPFIILS